MVAGMQPLVAAGTVLVAVSTIGGAGLARWWPHRRQVWFGAAAGALLVIAGVHLLPDAVHDARDAHLWIGAIPLAALGTFILAAFVARFGCACEADRQHASGSGSAAALTVHRFLEGSALALTASPALAIALGMHALGEGLAVGALLSDGSRRRLAVWVSLMCIGPLAGAIITSAVSLPAAVGPVLVAGAAGVLAQAARTSLHVAFPHRRLAVILVSPSTPALLIAAVVTTLAVHAAG